VVTRVCVSVCLSVHGRMPTLLHGLVPFCPYCRGVVMRAQNVSEYMLVLALCLVNNSVNDNNKNNQNDSDGAVIMASDHKSSPSSIDECRLSDGWPPTLRPHRPTWAVSLPVSGC